MPDHRPDPAGIFETDTHRRVLGHLSTPAEDVGYTPAALAYRLAGDPDTPIPPADQYGLADIGAGVDAVQPILDDLKAAGFAKRHAGDLWTMTQKGFDALTGEIANPPKVGDPITGPALINLGPTPLGGK